MATMPVETLLSDDELYSSKFLSDAPFDPPERRGGVMGLLGRLKHEPAIAEETPDSERGGLSNYKPGLKPSERKTALERLFRMLFPVQGHDVGHKLFMAVHEELVSMGENMFDIVAAEEQEAQQQKAQREADRLKREEERSMRECYMCEAKVNIEDMTEVDGEMMCADCAEEWGAKEEGCPNCDGTGRDTCPLCDGTNIPFPEEQNVSG